MLLCYPPFILRLYLLDISINYYVLKCQVRVVHGKEPNHFLAMFGGRLVIFAGGKAGWGSHQQDEGPGDPYLLHVRGTAAFNTKAEQVLAVLYGLVLFSADS